MCRWVYLGEKRSMRHSILVCLGGFEKMVMSWQDDLSSLSGNGEKS